MWVTFKDGQAALSAVKNKGNIQVCGINLSIKLKTNDWVAQVEKEIELCTTNCVQLCEYIDVTASSDYNSIGIPLAPSEHVKKKPPGRPALPKSPQFTPKHQTRHVVSFNKRFVCFELLLTFFARLELSISMISCARLSHSYQKGRVYRQDQKQWNLDQIKFHRLVNNSSNKKPIRHHQQFMKKFKKTL